MASSAFTFKYSVDPSGFYIDGAGNMRIFASTLYTNGIVIYGEPEVLISPTSNTAQKNQAITDAVVAYGISIGFVDLVAGNVATVKLT